MDALVGIMVIIGLVYAGLLVYLFILTVSTMRMHRQAMHALHQHLERQRLAEARARDERFITGPDQGLPR